MLSFSLIEICENELVRKGSVWAAWRGEVRQVNSRLGRVGWRKKKWAAWIKLYHDSLQHWF